jgi:hypothetical protein
VLVDVSHRGFEVKTQCTLHGHWGTRGGRRAWLCWWALEGSDQDSFLYIPKLGKDKGKKLNYPYSWPPQSFDPGRSMKPDDPRKALLRGKFCRIIAWSSSLTNLTLPVG